MAQGSASADQLMTLKSATPLKRQENEFTSSRRPCASVYASVKKIYTHLLRGNAQSPCYTSKSMNDNVQTSDVCERIEYSSTVPGVAAMRYYLPIPFSLLLSRDASSKSARGKIQSNLIWCSIKDGEVGGGKPLSILLGEETKNSMSSRWRGTSADSVSEGISAA